MLIPVCKFVMKSICNQMKMKSFMTFLWSLLLVLSSSCVSNSGNEHSENKPKYDTSSAEYQLAIILCDCFENFDENDSNGQFDAIECFMSNVQDGSLNDADEYKTNKIMKDICPESSAKFDKWQTKIQG
jgi:hypothetical protein